MDARTEAGPGPAAVAPAEAVEKAIGYLASVQLHDGGFAAFEHAEPDAASPGTPEPSPFVTASVLHALSLTDSPSARPLIDRCVDYLLREMEEPGVWRRASIDPPISPDVDVTCCAAFALRRLGFGAGSETAILANLSSDGLFRTWLRPPDAPNDFDSVVNANALLYLGERPETAVACEMLVGAILRGMEEATYYYYLDPLALHYAVSRAFAHGVSGFVRCRDAVVGRTLARQDEDGGWESDLLTGMAVCTLAGFGLGASSGAARGARLLAETQHADGSWDGDLFHAGPEPPAPHGSWRSSPALATALCLEALLEAGALE